MTTIQIPPDGVPAIFPLEIPAPADMTSLGGVRIYCIFAGSRPSNFLPTLTVDGVSKDVSDRGTGPTSLTFVSQFAPSIDAPIQAEIGINATGTLTPGNTVTVYAWGAQTETGEGALNPDEGGQPSTMTDTIEVGVVEVLTWPEWNRLTGANQGEGS